LNSAGSRIDLKPYLENSEDIIPEDLLQEHLINVVKDAFRGLGANKIEPVIHAGQALGTLEPELHPFDLEKTK